MTTATYVVEGGEWDVPGTVGSPALSRLNEALWEHLDLQLQVPGHRGKPRVGHGVAGFVRLGSVELHVIPKCFALGSVAEDWGRSVPTFLQLCRELSSQHVLVSGPGAFSPANTLLPWWADYYATVLWRALHASPFLRYEGFSGPLPYVRGRIDWRRQLQEWSSAGSRVWCDFRRYQADHVLNRLLRWAATRFMHVSRSARGMLGRCLDELHGVTDEPPARQEIDRIRIPASLRTYEEPFTIARALFFAMYPTLSRGEIPASGFLVRMDRAFEAFVDGVVHRVVRAARRNGKAWSVRSQDQRVLATPEFTGGRSLYTRPDDVVWEISGDPAEENGVVIDAKYKGLARDPGKYRKPLASDMYQVLASCIARDWTRGVVVSPAVSADDAWTVRRWRIEAAQAAEPVRITLLKVNLADLQDQKGIERLHDELRGCVEEGLT